MKKPTWNGANTEHIYIQKRVIDGIVLAILPKDFSRSCIFCMNNGFIYLIHIEMIKIV